MTMPDTLAYDRDAVTSIRVNIHRLGWRPVPVYSPDAAVKSAGKRPFLDDWLNVSAGADEETVRSWSSLRAAGNTGILTGTSGGGVVAVDIDVLVHEISAEILDLSREMLGETPLWRIGKAPKVLG